MKIKYILFPYIPSFLKKIAFGIKLVFNQNSYLVKTGFIESKTSISLTSKKYGELPWMPYPVIDFLNERLTTSMNVFEYGSGSSTIFFAKRAKSITSIEYDKNWYETIKSKLDGYDNSTLIFQEVSDDYVNIIETYDSEIKYEIVIVDGRERVKCAIKAFNKLKENGVLILDDSDRDRYTEALNFYTEKGFKKLSFSGLKPTGLGIDETSILYRSNNCINL